MLIKENKDLNKWREISCSWIGKLNTVKTSTLLKLIYRFNTIPIKSQQDFLHIQGIEKIVLKFLCKGKETGIAK